ncbi:MAG: PAC2 family protein [Actinobacteria bacterium]|nr:PAC2 family protein [Actinomycetota bacterium]
MTDAARISWEEPPETLRDPILVAAFRGWNDAGEAASFAASHMAERWSARRFASIDPEEFYDFQVVRPQVRLVDGESREITWPGNEFSMAVPGNSHRDVIILLGTEPNLRWKMFSSYIVDVIKRYEVGLVLTLGALLADVPHSRPVQITGTAVDRDLVARLGLQRSRYEGPTGIVGVLHDACARAGIPSASLWAAVPHYLAVTPNPKAALALVDQATRLVGTSLDLGELEAATAAYEDQVGEMVASDEDVKAYVQLLEDRTDQIILEENVGDARLPSGDAIAAELERYLQDRDPDE